MFATSLALIAQEFQGRERGTAIGAWGATIGGAVAIGPLVGGALTEGFGWEWIFFVNVPIGIGAIVLTTTKLANLRAPDPKPIDWPGLATFSLGLFALIFGLIRGNPEGWSSPQIVATLAGRRSCWSPSWSSSTRRDRDARSVPVPKARLRRCLSRGVRALRLDVRDVPVHHAVHPGRARVLAARGRRTSCR